MSYIRVPIGMKRKQNCESCGSEINKKEAAPGWFVPYPQILLLEHRDVDKLQHRGLVQVELCTNCMDAIGRVLETFIPGWQPAPPIQKPPGAPSWWDSWFGGR